MHCGHLKITKPNITYNGWHSEVTMSRKRDKGISLSEKLSSLIETRPSAIESDDDDLMTVNKIALNGNDSEYSADELDVSKFRQLSHQLLEEDDKKYSGKGISRRDLDSSIDSDTVDSKWETVNETDEESAAGSISDHNVVEDQEKTEPEEIEFLNNDSSEKLKVKINELEYKNIGKEIFFKAANDIEKGRAIRNQLHLWDFLLECRLKFQKCLAASNQLPNSENFPKFNEKGHPLFNESVVQCKKSLSHVLNSLLSLQDVLLKSNEEYRISNVSNYVEEIFSDSEQNETSGNSTKTSTKRLKTLNDFNDIIGKRHCYFQSYRNNTIQKWNDKTRIGYISNKNFSAFEQSTLKQIEHVLSDKQRLIKRTQTKRSNYHILGEEDEEPSLKKPTTEVDNLFITSLDNRNKGLHKEIFDDDDFYHQLLNEMVKRKANDVTDPMQLGKQWMQLQKIRTKMKKTVDTKASKGRKVRFVVHPKLVNFMMPIDNSCYSEESRTELFNSLFGKTKK